MEQQKLLQAKKEFVELVTKDMAKIQKSYAEVLGDVSAINCVGFGMDIANDTRLVYTFRSQCPESKALRDALLESIETRAVEVGLSGTSFFY